MRGKSSDRRTDALLDGNAVQDPLEQFDTLVDLDRRVEDAAAETPPAVAEPAVAEPVAAAAAPEPAERDAPTDKMIEARIESSIDTGERPTPVDTKTPRPKLVPRSAEPELVGIDGDELAWADEPGGSSRMGVVAGVVALLLLGAAGVVFVPQWLQREQPVAETGTIAKVDPIAYRAPQKTASTLLTVTAPASGAVADEPLPGIPASSVAAAELPTALATPVEPPAAVPPDTAPRQVAAIGRSTPAQLPTRDTDSPTVTAASTTTPVAPAPAPVPAGVAPHALHRVEPVLTAEDALEQDGSRIVLRVLVDERGAPIRVMVKEGVPGTAGVAKAIDAILRTRYEAGQRKGQPVRAWLLETFELPAS